MKEGRPDLQALACQYLRGDIPPAEQRRLMRGPLADATVRRQLRAEIRFDLAIATALSETAHDWVRTRALLDGVDDATVYNRIARRLPRRRSRPTRTAAGHRRRGAVMAAIVAILALAGWALMAAWPHDPSWRSRGLVDAPAVWEAGAPVHAGATPADLYFTDGSSLHVAPHSHAALAAGADGLDITDGAISAQVGDAAPTWLYRYAIADWRVRITGTRIGLGFVAGAPRLEVHHGAVTLDDGDTVRRVTAGMCVDANGMRPLRPTHHLVGWYPLLAAHDDTSRNRSPRSELGPLLLTGTPLDAHGVLLTGNAGVNIADPEARLAGLLREGRCTIACWVRWSQPPRAGVPQTLLLLHPTGPRLGEPFWALELPAAARAVIRTDSLHHLALRCARDSWAAFIDGVHVASLPPPNVRALQTGRTPVLHLCARWTAAGDADRVAYVPTRVHALAIYDLALTADDIRRCHAAGPDRVPRDLIPPAP